MTYRVHFQEHGSVQVKAGSSDEARAMARRGVKGCRVARVEPAEPLTASSSNADFEAWLDCMTPIGEPEPTPEEIEAEAAWLAGTLERIERAAEARRGRAGQQPRSPARLVFEAPPPAA